MPSRKPQPLPTEAQALWDWYSSNASNFLFGNSKLRGLVTTVDEHAAPGENPIKAFPKRPHLELLADLLLEEQLVAIAKSRQMMITWLALALILFEVLHPGKRWGISCKKFEAADKSLEKIEGMLQRLPEAFRPQYTKKQGLLTIHHPGAPSQVHAFSQDSEEARSLTYSGIMIDEAAFCDNLDALLAACMATVMGGGKLWLVSTPNFIERFHSILTDNGRLDI